MGVCKINNVSNKEDSNKTNGRLFTDDPNDIKTVIKFILLVILGIIGLFLFVELMLYGASMGWWVLPPPTNITGMVYQTFIYP